MQNAYLVLEAPETWIVDSHIVSFKGQCVINQDIDYSLEVISTSDICFENSIAELVSWRINGVNPIRFKAHIKFIDLVSKEDNYHHFLLQLCSPLYFLKLNKKSRIFKQKKFSSLIDSIFKDYPGILYQIEVDDSDLYKEVWLQYEQSDFEFLLRIVEESGAFFAVNQESVVLIQSKKLKSRNFSIDFQFAKNLKMKISDSLTNLSFQSTQFFPILSCLNYEGLKFNVIEIRFMFSEPKLNCSDSSQAEVFCFYEAIKIFSDKKFINYSSFLEKGSLRSVVINLNEGVKEFIFKLTWSCEDICGILTQPWVGLQQGWQFIPKSPVDVLLIGCEINYIWSILGCYNLLPIKTISKIKLPSYSIEIDKDIVVDSKFLIEKTVKNNFEENISGDYKFNVSGKSDLMATKSFFSLNSKSIVFKVGSSCLIIESNYVKIQSKMIELKTPAGVDSGLARLGDYHSCPLINPDGSPHLGGVIIESALTVRINNKPAARFRDSAHCFEVSDALIEGVEDLLIEGEKASYRGAASFHGGFLSTASENVVSAFSNSSSSSSIKTRVQVHEDPCHQWWVKISEL